MRTSVSARARSFERRSRWKHVLVAAIAVTATMVFDVYRPAPAAATALPKTWTASNDPCGCVGNAIGVAGPNNSVSANSGDHGPGILMTGPGVSGVSGRLKASWSMAVGSVGGGFVGDNEALVIASVLDNNNAVVATSMIHRKVFAADLVSQPIALHFMGRLDRSYDFVIHFLDKDNTYIRVDSVTLSVDSDAPVQTWEAENLSHATGMDSGDGAWEARVGMHTANYMTYGPYVNTLDGTYRAVFQLLTDQVTSDNVVLATIRVTEWNTVNNIIAERAVRRKDFMSGGTYQDFGLNFVATPGKAVELAVYWHNAGFVKQNHVRIHRPDPWQPFETESNPNWKLTGQTIAGEGVVGRQNLDPSGYIAVGPDSTALTGEGLGVFTLAIDNITGTDDVAVVSVSDPTTATFLATRTLKRNEFKHPDLYQDFRLKYQAPANTPVALNVRWLGNSTLKVNRTRAEDIVGAGNKRFSDWWSNPSAVKLRGNSENHNPGRPDGEVTQTTLTQFIDANATTLQVQDGSKLPDTTSNGPFWVRLLTADADELPSELVQVTVHSLLAPNVLTVASRAGTTQFGVGAYVRLQSGRRQNFSVSSVVSNGALYYGYYEWVNENNDVAGMSLAISSDGGKTFTPYNGGEPVLRPGNPGSFDAVLASVAQVIRIGDGFLMVYEAYGGSGATLVGWATSPDGITWTKGASPAVNPDPNPSAWDSHLSSPTVSYFNGVYYVWYSGASVVNGALSVYDSRGYASGTSMAALVKRGAPVMVGGAGPNWDSGAIGRTSVNYDGWAYFMTYEGGTSNRCIQHGADPNPRWGVGVARSTDLVNWSRAGANPLFRSPNILNAGCTQQAPSAQVINGKQMVSVFADGRDHLATFTS